MKQVPFFRIFLSSPSDVLAERTSVHQALLELNTDVFLRGQVAVDVVSWNDSTAPTGIFATLSPQEAIARNLPRPAECDLTVVIFGRRFGTHLGVAFRKPDGSPYLSGTEWEYEDAVSGGREVLVYRRDSGPGGDTATMDPDEAEQVRRLETFLGRFERPDGSLSGGANPYTSAQDLKTQVLAHVRQHLLRFIGQRQREVGVRRRAAIVTVLTGVLSASAAFWTPRLLQKPVEIEAVWLWNDFLPTLRALSGDGDELATASSHYLQSVPTTAAEVDAQYKAMNYVISRYGKTRDRFFGLGDIYKLQLEEIGYANPMLYQALQGVFSSALIAFPKMDPAVKDSSLGFEEQYQRLRALTQAYGTSYESRLWKIRGQLADLERRLITSAGLAVPDCWSGK